jgi:hypothetical protein
VVGNRFRTRREEHSGSSSVFPQKNVVENCGRLVSVLKTGTMGRCSSKARLTEFSRAAFDGMPHGFWPVSFGSRCAGSYVATCKIRGYIRRIFQHAGVARGSSWPLPFGPCTVAFSCPHVALKRTHSLYSLINVKTVLIDIVTVRDFGRFIPIGTAVVPTGINIHTSAARKPALEFLQDRNAMTSPESF